MSYYESTNSGWPNSRAGWDRSGATTFQRPHASNQPDLTVRYAAQMKTEDTAFGSQLDEVDRAVDNLVKSGKMFAPQRRESMPVVAPRTFPIEHVEPRMVPVQQIPARHFPGVPEYDPVRNVPKASLQNFIASQRFQPARPSEAEQLMQAQRRLAAQRERELRNYHQEQQFNRTIMAEMSTYGKERVMSPGSMTEEERRELIARQRAALYSSEGQIHHDDGLSVDENGTPRQLTNTGSVTGSTRGPSPLSFDPFGLPSQNGHDMQSKIMGDHHQSSATVGNTPARSRTNSASSPSSKSANFNMFDNGNQQVQNTNRTSASSPGGSPPRGQSRGPGGAIGSGGVAPIGTRPSSQAQAINPALSNKRSTTPLPSPLSYGFTNSEDPFNNGMPNERSASAASNQSGAPNGQDGSNIPNWGNSKVWGNNKGLGSVASVWALS